MRITTPVFVVDCEQDTAPVLVASLNKNTREAVDPPFEEVEDDIKSRKLNIILLQKKVQGHLIALAYHLFHLLLSLLKARKLVRTRIKLF